MATYDYGAVMFQCDFPNWNEILKQIKPEDLYINEAENIKGLEVEPHVTIVYGFHDNIDHQDLIKTIKQFPSVNLKLLKIDSFNNEDFDVLKINVDKMELLPLRKVLMGKYANTQSFKGYNPHITLAYLKKGKSKKYHNKNISKNITCSKLIYSSPSRPTTYIDVS